MTNKENQFKLVSLETLFKEVENHPKRNIIWKGISEGTMGYIFGPSKSGKTTLAENLAISIACGRSSFFGNRILVEAQKVLVISFEENSIQRTERARKQIELLDEHEKALVLKNYYQPDSNFTYNLVGEDDWLRLSTVIEKSGAKIVVIDSLTRLYSGSIEDSKESQKLTLNLRKLQDKLGITVICIHHSIKNQPILTQDSIAGSRVVLQECDFAIGVNKTNTGKLYVKDVLYRYAEPDNDFVEQFEINENGWVTPLGKTKEYSLSKKYDGRRNDENLKKLEDYLSKNHKSGVVATKQLIEFFVDTKSFSKPTLHNLLEKLIDNKRLQKLGNGVYKLPGVELNEVKDEEE